jgi:hypothetical protein
MAISPSPSFMPSGGTQQFTADALPATPAAGNLAACAAPMGGSL